MRGFSSFFPLNAKLIGSILLQKNNGTRASFYEISLVPVTQRMGRFKSGEMKLVYGGVWFNEIGLKTKLALG